MLADLTPDAIQLPLDALRAEAVFVRARPVAGQVQPEQPRERPPTRAPKAHDVGGSNLVSLVHDPRPTLLRGCRKNDRLDVSDVCSWDRSAAEVQRASSFE